MFVRRSKPMKLSAAGLRLLRTAEKSFQKWQRSRLSLRVYEVEVEGGFTSLLSVKTVLNSFCPCLRNSEKLGLM